MISVQNIAVNFHAASSADLWVEELAEQSDLLAGDPATWPAFLDDERFGLGPAEIDDRADLDTDNPSMDEEPTFEPAPEDRSWLAPLDVADELDDLHATAAWLERLEQMHAVTDADLMAAGLPVG